MQKDSEQEKHTEPMTFADSVAASADLFSAGSAVLTEPLSDLKTASDGSTFSSLLLTDQSTLAECASPYKRELIMRGKSAYTVTCFLSDLKMFTAFIGPSTPVGRISKEQLTDWLMKLKFGASQMPAPKTMARRVTFLKNFFSWLDQEEVLSENPSASLTLERPMPPLPQLLSDEEIQALLDVTKEDVRCQCLVYLVLSGGLKKEEVMRLKIQNIDTLDPHAPLVTVRFEASAGKQHRERRVALPAAFADVFHTYVSTYKVEDILFPYTDRNLNYILARAVKAAGIEKRVTLQLLRDMFAVQQLRAGTTFDSLREKLGLSDEAWLESKEKYRRLAFPQ